jgi:hypothetical protein
VEKGIQAPDSKLRKSAERLQKGLTKLTDELNAKVEKARIADQMKKAKKVNTSAPPTSATNPAAVLAAASKSLEAKREAAIKTQTPPINENIEVKPTTTKSSSVKSPVTESPVTAPLSKSITTIHTSDSSSPFSGTVQQQEQVHTTEMKPRSTTFVETSSPNSPNSDDNHRTMEANELKNNSSSSLSSSSSSSSSSSPVTESSSPSCVSRSITEHTTSSLLDENGKKVAAHKQ